VLVSICGVASTLTAGEDMAEFYHGTLNLCIGNKNGLVVVTDSRASGRDQKGNDLHEDWHQKLFQISEKIVVTIAGYNRVPLNKVPIFQAPAAGVILNYIGDMRSKHHTPGYLETVRALTYLMGFYLEAVGSIKQLTETDPSIKPEDYHLVMMVIGMDGETVKITQIDIGLKKRFSSGSAKYLIAQSDIKETVVNGFEFCAVGQKAVAERVLQDVINSTSKEERDTLPLSKIVEMASKTMHMTAESNKYVGAVTQMGILEGGVWKTAIVFPPPLGPFIQFNSLYDVHIAHVGKAFVSNGPILLVVSGFFEKTTVLLGKPYYYFGNQIKNSTVIVEDEDFSFDDSNKIENSTLVIGEKVNRKSGRIKSLITGFPWKNREDLRKLLVKE
jgi:hypothetical protein